MSNIPDDLRYSASHEWLKLEADGTARVGITDHAQAALGDLVFVEVPEAGSSVTAGDACAVVESVKAASDIYSPVTGEIIEGNPALEDTPEAVNSDPYGDGWIFRIKIADDADITSLMNADAYQASIEGEGH